ncbi:hypothetical protein [Acrocarpospora sp. B8E8]|uniref:hypothetical protein n=1 Tax=Acrocarpospora sp. B8E8 TaxID=3153572 RepID=UPI00325EC67B
MRLTWKDAITTVVMAAVVALYVAYTQGSDLLLASSVRWTTVSILVLGMVGGCAFGAADQLYGASRSTFTRAYTVVTTVLGVTALTAAVVGLIAASEVALTVLFAATATLWLLATVRHMLPVTARPSEPRTIIDHEVIDPEKPVRR